MSVLTEYIERDGVRFPNIRLREWGKELIS